MAKNIIGGYRKVDLVTSNGQKFIGCSKNVCRNGKNEEAWNKKKKSERQKMEFIRSVDLDWVLNGVLESAILVSKHWIYYILLLL